MEKVTLNNVQLDILAESDPELKPYFYGTIACEELPSRPRRTDLKLTSSTRIQLTYPDAIGSHCGLSVAMCVK